MDSSLYIFVLCLGNVYITILLAIIKAQGTAGYCNINFDHNNVLLKIVNEN